MEDAVNVVGWSVTYVQILEAERGPAPELEGSKRNLWSQLLEVLVEEGYVDDGGPHLFQGG